ncbi:MDR family MFS transporter [Thalassiella azotivora]
MSRPPAPVAADASTGTTSGQPVTGRPLALLFVGLMLTMLLASLNQTVLSTALPTVVGELHGVEHMGWVITAFILASTVTMPVYGRVSDVLGRRPLLVTAISLFVAGSVMGGLADTMSWLIAARVVQGLGGGGLMILSQATIADVIPARERGRYVGVMGGVFAFSSVAGPLLGGWFTEGPGWRWVFWINLPLGALAAGATLAFLRLPRRAERRARHDYPGMALLAVATTAVVLVSTWGGTQYAWTSTTVLGLAAVAVVATAAFVWAETRAAEPVMPLSLFRDRNFTLTTVASVAMGVGMFGAVGYVPTYLQMATGASATAAGLLMIPMMGALLAVSIASGQAVTRTGRYKALPVVGSAAATAGLLGMSTLDVGDPTWLVCLWLAVVGAGLGASMQIMVLIVQNSFPPRMVGTATAANNYFRQIGATLGVAVVGSLFTSRLTSLLAERLSGLAGPADGSASLTPELVQALPDAVRVPVVESYHEALIPLFLVLAPLMLVSVAAMAFVTETPLATTLDGGADQGAAPGTGTTATEAEAVAGAQAAPGPVSAGDGRGPAGPRP